MGFEIAKTESRDIVSQQELQRVETLNNLLSQIRPYWSQKSLVERVVKLTPVDPSSACQRLLNAAFTDLKEKIIRAGIDLAKVAANENKLPPISRIEDILENYSSTNVLELSYRMGIITRPEWKRLKRCYDIRRDLEHEDNEYEAQIEDCIYIFKTCIEVVLSKDATEIIKVDDLAELVNRANSVSPSQELIEDFAKAPDTRQQEILLFLCNYAMDSSKTDIARQNSMEALRRLSNFAMPTSKIAIAEEYQKRTGKRAYTEVFMKVASAAGILPFLKQRKVSDFFEEYYEKLSKVPHNWRYNEDHGSIIDELEDFGGLRYCPEKPRLDILKWMTLCYLGEPGGYGAGYNRLVFYSNEAAPKIERLIAEARPINADVERMITDSSVKASVDQSKHIQKRYEKLIELAKS